MVRTSRIGKPAGALFAVLLCSCQAGAGAPGQTAPPAAPRVSGDAATGAPAPGASPVDALFPEPARGWKAVDRDGAARIAAFATDYAAFLATAKTSRRAVSALVERFSGRGTRLEPGMRPSRAPGSRYWLTGPGGDDAAFVLLGREPLERGARIVIASVDAPHLALEHAPIHGQAGVTLLDTEPHGQLVLEAWLSRPLALYMHVARPGAMDGGLDLAIGDAPGDPVLTIPDLDPHLARRIQRERIVDTPRRLDAVAAVSRAAVLQLLTANGLDERVLGEAEIALVPAGPPVFVGVDRALLAGHGHADRALAYAAVRGLIDASDASHTAIVIVTGRRGPEFIKPALSRIMAALTEGGDELDILDTRRVHARSAVLLAGNAEGAAGKGLLLAPHSDDAPPPATRRVLDVLGRAGVHYQISDADAWGMGRRLSTLDMDVVEVALPVQGSGSPVQVVSTLDLYQAYVAALAWLAQS